MWLHALAEEARPQDEHSGIDDQQARVTFLLDIVKCLSSWNVSGSGVSNGGVQTRLLRMLYVVYSLPRRLPYQGTATTGGCYYGSIVVRSRLAVICTHTILIWSMEQLLGLFPAITPSKYVDDVSLVAQGAVSIVADTTFEAFGG